MQCSVFTHNLLESFGIVEQNLGKLIPSERGGRILSYKGYLYSTHSSNKARTRRYWVCRRKPECKQRATTEEPSGKGEQDKRVSHRREVRTGSNFVTSRVAGSDEVEVFKAPADHPGHLPNPEEGDAIERYQQIKRRAEEHPEAPPAQILQQELPLLCFT
ncbi:uncharacterized protein LOC127750706 [Frankliniella occidentalis]|uniref:Uncharacterized protein LOC127750706 n=1 Tax=Frankliniella occidentalis TaxID=133901 RepID=A0A9C6X4M9_FRAOC|nr:uncharacterized protein LOC127750706 [Frankliniella occidentalis]